jgi:hypothetical protein
MWRRPFLLLLTAIALALAGFGAGVPLSHAATTTGAVGNHDYDDLSTFAQSADRSTLRVAGRSANLSPRLPGDLASFRFGVAAEEGSTQLFRHVGEDELADIRASGEFRVGPQGTGKYFAENPKDAARWGEWLNPGGGAVVETRAANSFADQLKRWEKLDGIGPARFVPPEDIARLNRAMNGIQEVRP